MELSVLADCDVALLIFHGTSGKLTQYSSAPMGGLLQRFAHACGRPHETYTNEDLYSHHVLARLASDAEEAAGAGAQHARTLPSFWAAKAALERQRQRGPRRHKGAASGSEQAGGEEGEEGEAPPRRKRARLEADRAVGCADGMEVDQSEGEEESLSSFSELDRHAATLAQLAHESGAQLTPRSRAAYGRIEREFDLLIARAREEMETAEALAAAADEPEGSQPQTGAEQEGSDEKPELSFGADLPQQQQRSQQQQQQQQAAAPGLERQQSAVASAAAAAAAAGAAVLDSAAAAPKLPGSPPAVTSPTVPREPAQPVHSLAFAPQPHHAASTAAGQASQASGTPTANGLAPAAAAAAAGVQQLAQTPPGAAAPLLPPAGSATAPPSQAPAVRPGQPGMLPPGARIQLQAFPTGSGFMLRPVAILSGAAAPGAAAAPAAGGPAAPGVMLQLQPVAAQAQGRGAPTQLPPMQLAQLLKLQQQQLAAFAAVQQQAARLQAQQAQAQAQQQQQQPQQPVAPGGAAATAAAPATGAQQPQQQQPRQQQQPAQQQPGPGPGPPTNVAV
ncbi:hypothetical protein C2E21_5816 [Chlorella sorokiniana]|uniref:MADS-box domain-containing protein n=1 Tax=Chlorella sorokiniana TaxID=3076 RepID=A0A2P6TM36_CHLSO|nr:hypothetical protein C2E21_5816 [Chlorella sorokiniana]|eukprot:PRW45392.1 hypothetical protein C2E21_5816 [Chlorella sorokiniana]